MRVLPRSEDVGIPQGDALHRCIGGVELQISLSDPLADPIRRDRVSGVALGSGPVNIPVQHSARGREHEPLDPRAISSLQHRQQAHDVDIGVEVRLPHRQTHRHLRSLVRDRLRANRLEHLLHSSGVANIDFMQRNASGQVVPIPCRQVVNDMWLVARSEKLLDNMAADESGSAGDDDAHEIGA